MGKPNCTMEDLGMMHDFWKNKKVLVTGHTGFKGSWLCLWLQSLNAEVVGFALPSPSSPNLFSLAKVEKNMESLIGDIRDYKAFSSVISKHQPEIIFHLAAQPLVRRSYQDPIETYSTNVMGTVHLLEAARTIDSCRAIVNVTTDKCYENNEWYWGYRENDRLGGYDPYSNSKACAELVTGAFRNSFYQNSSRNCGLASARAGNVIGGGDWAEDRLIPTIIDGIYNNEPINIRYPSALRPWQHVLEPLQGYMQLAQALYNQPTVFSEAWNFGPFDFDVKPVSWLVKKMLKLSGNDFPWQVESGQQLHEANYLKLDSSKAINKLGWSPRWNLETTLEQTIDWYEAYYHGVNMFDKTVFQIEHYSRDTSISTAFNNSSESILEAS